MNMGQTLYVDVDIAVAVADKTRVEVTVHAHAKNVTFVIPGLTRDLDQNMHCSLDSGSFGCAARLSPTGMTAVERF